jgi:carboxypeptidase Taq
MSKVDDLIEELKTLAKYGSALAVLGWDEEVNLPTNAHAYRGEVNALLSSDLHKKFTGAGLYELVNRLTQDRTFATLSAEQKVIVRETRRDIEQARKLPSEFVEKMALLTTRAFGDWVKARAAKDFKLFQPALSEIVEMKKHEARLLGFTKSPYDALLDEFEPGLTATELDKVLP